MTDAALIIASPWPMTGSANIFAAQSLLCATRGYRTAMLLSPHRPEHRRRFTSFWTSTLSAMHYEGLDLLCCAETSRRMRRWRSLSFWQWLLHGCDSELAVMARYAAAARLPLQLTSFLESSDVRVVIVNHCFQMKVAETICKYLERKGRRPPLVVLETHDVQADLYAVGRIVNSYSGRTDCLQRLTRDELRLAHAADVMTYVCEDDMQYFNAPTKVRHELVLATLDPANERRLLQLNATPGDVSTRPIDFLYVGNNNPGNRSSILWFLNEVMPLLGDAYSIAIVGRIAGDIKATNPALYERFARYFVEEVPDIISYYRDAAVVIAPTTFGTGTSIKVIEALAAGKPVVATSTAVRGLPTKPLSAAVQLTDDPADFAKAMVETHRRWRELGSASRAIYLEHFSNARYFERWDRILPDAGASARGQPE